MMLKLWRLADLGITAGIKPTIKSCHNASAMKCLK